jgi:hypothetical protein
MMPTPPVMAVVTPNPPMMAMVTPMAVMPPSGLIRQGAELGRRRKFVAVDGRLGHRRRGAHETHSDCNKHGDEDCAHLLLQSCERIRRRASDVSPGGVPSIAARITISAAHGAVGKGSRICGASSTPHRQTPWCRAYRSELERGLSGAFIAGSFRDTCGIEFARSPGFIASRE